MNGIPKEGENIRAWYQRTTGRSRWIVAWSVLLVLPLGIALYEWLPQSVHAKLQVFNGAYTIPAAAAIWIYAFVYLFLVPSREAGFVSVESVQRCETLIRDAVEKKVPEYWERDVKPVLDTWNELGKRLEKRLDPATLDGLLDGLIELSRVGRPPDPLRGLGAFARNGPARVKKETPS
jgi:hypothetical protein